MTTAIALAHPNIAFIKYWGNRDPDLKIPSNGSISMNLAALNTQTRVTFEQTFLSDSLIINGVNASDKACKRASIILDQVRIKSGIQMFAEVESWNNFPTGTGIASSASGFAALALAAASAAGLDLQEAELSRLARRASGSACRSIASGFVEWQAGTNDANSFAFSIAPDDYWQLIDCIAIVSLQHKAVTSLEGHDLAKSSSLQSARVQSSPPRLQICKEAILKRDFSAFAEIIELDSNMMHAVMMTSTPPLFYWMPETIRIMQAVFRWRQEGLPVCCTVDAGPNVHVICEGEIAALICERLNGLDGVRSVLSSEPGGAAHLITGITHDEDAC